MDPSTILSHFNIPQNKYQLLSNEHGLINKSFEVSTPGGKKSYFLQHIDKTIFKDIEGLMNNISVVTSYFESLQEPPNHLTIYSAKNGFNYYKTATGEYWRLYDFVEGDTYYKAENIKMAAEAGKIYGEFQEALSGIDLGKLKTTIPGFHDIDLRYDQFNTSLISANEKRKKKATDLINSVHKNIEYVKRIYHDVVKSCPQRVTHNDTKLSNVLFDKELKAICVVDYDTLMPGYLPLDFGDSVRTICSTTVEDDPDLNGTYFDLNIFKSFTSGFFKPLKGSISEAELTMLPRTVAYMPFLMGLRMLTDYLNNDIYYATDYDDHNFKRASNQLTLFMSGVEQLAEMNNIVKQNNPNLENRL